MHIAVKNIKKLKDNSYLNRLLDLGFPMYQINYDIIRNIFLTILNEYYYVK
jgi:hypothetical protein